MALALMDSSRENPTPLPSVPSSHVGAQASVEQWRVLSEQHQDEDVFLCELAGVSQLDQITELQAVINTTHSTVSHLGAKLPNLTELNLSNSVIESLRDLGTGFRGLQVLWVCRCSLASLDGLSVLEGLRELYAAYNDISDLQPLSACVQLEVLDLEGNCVSDPDSLDLLTPCTSLISLNLTGNPLSHTLTPARAAAAALQALPSLQTYNDEPMSSYTHTQPDTDTDPSTSSTQHSPEGATGSQGSAQCVGGDVTQGCGDTHTGLQSDDMAEWGLVLEGIKHARVGVDSHEFREVEGSKLMAAASPSGIAGGAHVTVPWGPYDSTSALSDSTSAPPSASGSAGAGAASSPRPGSTASAAAATGALGAAPLLPPTASAWLRTLRSSTAGALASLRMSRENSTLSGLSVTPPGCDGTAATSPSPSTSTSRPQSSDTTTARHSAASAPAHHRPPSAHHRPPSASVASCLTRSTSVSGPRPATATGPRPFSSRPGTGSVAGMSGSGLWAATNTQTKGNLYWTKHRLDVPASATLAWGATSGTSGDAARGGVVAEGEDADDAARAASALTLGGDAIGGSLARDLRRRRKGGQGPATAPAGLAGKESQGPAAAWRLAAGGLAASAAAQGSDQKLYDAAGLLEELRRWKMETADRALMQEEAADTQLTQWGDNSTDNIGVSTQGPAAAGGIAGAADILDLTQDAAQPPAAAAADRATPFADAADASEWAAPAAASPGPGARQVSLRQGSSRRSGLLPQPSVPECAAEASAPSREQLVAGILDTQGQSQTILKGEELAAIASAPINDPRARWMSKRSVLSKVVRDMAGGAAGGAPGPRRAASARVGASRATEAVHTTAQAPRVSPQQAKVFLDSSSRQGSGVVRGQAGSEKSQQVRVLCAAGEVTLSEVNPRPRVQSSVADD